jgi:hypothetical protein
MSKWYKTNSPTNPIVHEDDVIGTRYYIVEMPSGLRARYEATEISALDAYNTTRASLLKLAELLYDIAPDLSAEEHAKLNEQYPNGLELGPSHGH